MKAKLRKNMKKIFLLILGAIFLFTVSMYSTAYAGSGRTETERDSMRKGGTGISNVVVVNKGLGEDVSSFGDDTKAIGINKLFGLGTRNFEYHGEVPWEAQNNNSEYKQNPTYVTHWCSGAPRTWTQDTQKTGDFDWEKDKTNDLHAKNLTKGSDFLAGLSAFARNILFGLFCGINTIGAMILNLLIWVSNIDVSTIAHDIIQIDSLNKTITTLFIGTDSSLSPLLIIACVVFIVSLIILAAKRIKSGDVSMHQLLTEFLMLILAAILAAFCLTGSNVKITDNLVKMSNTFLAAFGRTSTANINLFTYESSNSTSDMINTEQAICSKLYVDTMVRGQFGNNFTNISDLDLWNDDDPNATQNNWGISTADMKWIVDNLTGDDNHKGEQLFVVRNGINDSYSNKKAPNLGYYMYCACSNRSYDEPFWINNGKVTVNNGDAEGAMVYIADVLASIDAKADGSIKAQALMDAIYSYAPPAAEMFLVVGVTLAEAAAIIIAAGFALMGKVIFNVGSLLMPILPIMILIPQLGIRNKIKQVVMTYLMAGVKMLLGQAYIYLIIFSTAILCESGIIGQLFAIIILVALTRATPSMFAAINDALDSAGGGSLGAVRAISGKFSDVARKVPGQMNPKNFGENAKNLKNTFQKKFGKELSPEQDLNGNAKKTVGGAVGGYGAGGAGDFGSIGAPGTLNKNMFDPNTGEWLPNAGKMLALQDKAAQGLSDAAQKRDEALEKLKDKDKLQYLMDKGLLNDKDAKKVKAYWDKKRKKREDLENNGTRLQKACSDFLETRTGKVLTAIPFLGAGVAGGMKLANKYEQKFHSIKNGIQDRRYNDILNGLSSDTDENGKLVRLNAGERIRDKFHINEDKKKRIKFNIDDMATKEIEDINENYNKEVEAINKDIESEAARLQKEGQQKLAKQKREAYELRRDVQKAVSGSQTATNAKLGKEVLNINKEIENTNQEIANTTNELNATVKQVTQQRNQVYKAQQTAEKAKRGAERANKEVSKVQDLKDKIG